VVREAWNAAHARAHRHPRGAGAASDGRGRQATYRTHRISHSSCEITLKCASRDARARDVCTHTPPTTAHKKNTRRLAFQATKHIQYASNIYMRVFMRGRRPVARGGPFARGWFYVDRARAREGVLRVIPSIWMWVFKCTTRARWRFARATDRDRKKNPSAGAGCTGDRRRSAMRGVTTPHDRRRPRTTLAQHTNIYSSPCRRR